MRGHLQGLQEAARCRRDTENARNNNSRDSAEYSLKATRKRQNEQAVEDEFAAILAKCDPTSASSLDEAIQAIRNIDGLPYQNKNRLFDEIRKNCPYKNRAKFLEAICESAELEFDGALDLMIECVEAWRDTMAHVKRSVPELITKLFAFKGSKLFDLRYSGISRQIYRLSELCGDPKFVLQTALETIAKERLELGGDEWLQIATSLSCQTDPSAALHAFEDLLSSSAGKIGDEIGEGVYRAEFACKTDEVDVVADIIWHLLGDSDAFVRWSAARSLKCMLDVGLTEDIGRLLDRFDVEINPSLSSDEHHFAFLNAQQWLLMGLARAALYHGEKLKPLKSKVEALAKRADLHALNKLHLARCLRHIEGDKSMSLELKQLWDEIQTPEHGIVERKGWPDNKDRQIDFGFDYDFKEHKISKLARLFWISDNEASDFIANEVMKRWPDSNNMSDFPGRVRYRGDDRFETYREHIQRHALLHAATTLMKSRPVARSSYDWNDGNLWQEFLADGDVSFEDGSWLSDHKDRVPEYAREHLLGERKENQEMLVHKRELFRKVGFPENFDHSFLPLYGYWKSPDGVYVSFFSALIQERGAVGQCIKFSKMPDHDLWLPSYHSGGRVDRYAKKVQFDPLVWEPEKYPIGIDEGDEWAARGAIARPKLGLALNKLLGLTPDDDERQWYDHTNKLALKSEVWGEWRPDPDVHRSRYQDEGAILWAERDWLDSTLKSCKRSLIFKLGFSKYKSSRSYDDLSGLKELYVGMKRSGELPRFWFAKKASEAVY